MRGNSNGNREVAPKPRYLVTGGAGFIGSHLVGALASGGHEVTVLDNLSTGRPENLEEAAEAGSVELIQGSILDEYLVDELVASNDICIHLAAAVGVKLIIDHPLETLHCNVRGTEIVLEAASRHHARLLFASSSEIYGKNSDGPLREDSDRLLGSISRARWAYANTKSFGEFLANSHAGAGADMAVFRLFNTSGPRQLGAYGMVVPTFVSQALAGRPLTVYGDGEQTRCFTHVADAVRAIMALAVEPRSRGLTFNIGADAETTILDLAKLVIEETGSQSEIELVPYERAYGEGFEELGRRRPETSAINELTGWSADRSVTEIINDVIAFERGRTLASAG